MTLKLAKKWRFGDFDKLLLLEVSLNPNQSD